LQDPPVLAELLFPVSCVEEGRWHELRPDFEAARDISDPELRRRKARPLSEEPLEPGVAQQEVWRHVREKTNRLGSHSPTLAHADTYHARESELAELRDRFPLAPGQSGAILALPNRAVCLDYLSRPDTFAQLYAKLLDGYLLDAIEHVDREPNDDTAGFIAAVERGGYSHSPSAALGVDLRLHGHAVIGSGLALEGELIQLSAFTNSIGRPARRIAPPSGRPRI
jgi:hypothetical protein